MIDSFILFYFFFQTRIVNTCLVNMASRDESILCLFDVDGTLTPARQVIRPDMEEFLEKLKTKVVVGLVGGSDLGKISEQMTTEGKDKVYNRFEYVFAENGLVAYEKGKLIGQESILKFMGEEKLQRFLNFAMKSMSEITLPAKRGTFFEFRNGMINVCPVGRSCSQAERDEFSTFDKEHHVRTKLVEKFEKEFPPETYGLTFAIGGQISIDVFPNGWDKRISLKYVENNGYREIHFFGDKTAPGGNDHGIFEDSRTIGHTVANPSDTIDQCTKLFLS